MTTGREALKQSVVGLVSSAMTVPASPYGGPGLTPVQAVNDVRYMTKRRRLQAWLTDAGTAATASAECAIAFCDPGCDGGWQVVEVDVAFPVAVTASNTNYATITLSKRTSGGAAAIVATDTTQITDPVLGANAVAYQRYALTLSATAANTVLATATDVLTLSLAKAGTGVAVAAATGPGVMVEVVIEEL